MLTRRFCQRGVTLVELMVGLVVGLIVILGAMAMYLGASKSGRETVRVNRFNQDLRAVMDIITSDLRRVGYSGVPGSGTLFTEAATDMRIYGANRECILFSYDTTWRNPANPGVTAGTDFGGFRLNNGVVQALRTQIADTTTACDQLEWEDLTDAKAVKVTKLQFDFGGSSCLTANPKTYNPSASSSYASWTTTYDSDAPTDKSGCDPLAPGAAASAAAIPAGSAIAELRRITITLQGESNAANKLQRAPLVETVLVRNHRVVLP
jgi:prepilin-type N-terminal cleavage/methylation domain-containing protein